MTGSTPEEERACRPARPNTAQADAFSRPDVGDRPQAPTTPLGFDELSVAGGLRGKSAELVECLTVAQKAIARAEIVVEGEI